MLITIPMESGLENIQARSQNDLKNIPKDITELNNLIYAEAKLVHDRTGISQRNSNKNTKPGWEIRPERQIKKQHESRKILKKEKYTWNEIVEKRQHLTTLTIQLNERNKKNIGKRKPTEKVLGQGQEIRNKKDLQK